MLSAPPTVSPQTQTLLDAVTAEQDMIWIYDKAIAAHSGLTAALAPLRAQHRAHLAQLRARVIEPPGKRIPDTVTARPALGATQASAVATLRAAEQAAVTRLMRGLGSAPASLAQLYASIAASEATHVTVLGSRTAAR